MVKSPLWWFLKKLKLFNLSMDRSVLTKQHLVLVGKKNTTCVSTCIDPWWSASHHSQTCHVNEPRARVKSNTSRSAGQQYLVVILEFSLREVENISYFGFFFVLFRTFLLVSVPSSKPLNDAVDVSFVLRNTALVFFTSVRLKYKQKIMYVLL